MTEADKALKDLTAVTRRYRRVEKSFEEVRDAATEAVIAALKAGARPTDVATESPFSPAHVRNLARANGIGPARKGQASESRDPAPPVG